MISVIVIALPIYFDAGPLQPIFLVRAHCVHQAANRGHIGGFLQATYVITYRLKAVRGYIMTCSSARHRALGRISVGERPYVYTQ